MIVLAPPNAVAAHGDDVPVLDGKERIDYEAKLGDVISTGTPAGVGPVAPGDTVEVEREDRDAPQRSRRRRDGRLHRAIEPVAE